MKPPFARVLCPTDLSAVGNRAVPVAYALASGRGTVHLVHVAEPPYLGNPLYTQFATGYVPTPEETAAGEERIRRTLRDLVPDEHAQRGVRTEVHVVSGVNVARALAELAEHLDADVLVLGSHGRTGLARVLMGSVATDLLREDVRVILVHDRKHLEREEEQA